MTEPWTSPRFLGGLERCPSSSRLAMMKFNPVSPSPGPWVLSPGPSGGEKGTGREETGRAALGFPNQVSTLCLHAGLDVYVCKVSEVSKYLHDGMKDTTEMVLTSIRARAFRSERERERGRGILVRSVVCICKTGESAIYT